MDVDLSCSENNQGDHKPFAGITWSPQSQIAKIQLLTTSEVQSSYSSCYYFAQIIKTECGLTEPVMLLYLPQDPKNQLTTFVTTENIKLANNVDLPLVFKKYFSGEFGPKSQSMTIASGLTQNSIVLNKNGQFTSSQNTSFSFGPQQTENVCKVTAGRTSCADQIASDDSFKANLQAGIFQILSDKFGVTYKVNVQSFNNTKFEFLKNWPFMQITGDEGIAWAASNQFNRFILKSGQRLNLTSDVAYANLVLFMQDDGNLVLRNLTNGHVLWKSETENFCTRTKTSCASDLKYFAKFENGKLEILYGNESNSEQVWQGVNIGAGDYFLKITATEPYITVFSNASVPLQKWPTSKYLSCLSTEKQNVTCLHPEMPLYFQADPQLLSYVNQKENINLPVEPGWCGFASMGMVGKTYANEKLKYFDISKNIYSKKTNSFLDQDFFADIIWNFMDRNVTASASANNTPRTVARAVDSVVVATFGEHFPDMPAANQEVFAYLPARGGLLLNLDNYAFGIGKDIESREKRFLDKMPMGLIAVQSLDKKRAHMLAVNGLERSNWLKVYDPWGSIYSIYIKDPGVASFGGVRDIAKNPGYFESAGTQNVVMQRIFHSYVPIKQIQAVPSNQACVLNGKSIAHGESVYAYKFRNSLCSDSQEKESRKCINGKLDGSFPFVSCSFAVITNQPVDTVASHNRSVAVFVTAKGENLSYQWYRNDQIISGANARVYSFTSGSQDSVNYYKVRISNQNQSIESDKAKVTIHKMQTPVITTQPVATVSVKQGNNVNLSVQATGEDLHYSWFLDGNSIADANKNTYSFVADKNSHQKKYSVQVFNSEGGVQSNNTLILLEGSAVTQAVSISTQPMDKVYSYNITAVISVVAQGGNLSYQWYKNDQIITGANNSSYSFNTGSLELVDFYKVKVWNEFQTVESNAAKISVHKVGLPLMVTPPAKRTVVKLGDVVNLSVGAEGENLKYQWGTNANSKINGATSSSYSFTANALNKAGCYLVRVSNPVGYVDSGCAIVAIADKPKLIEQLDSEALVRPGDTVNLAVYAQGVDLSYKWYKDGQLIGAATSDNYSFSANTQSAGAYKVIVSNIAGSVESVTVISLENTSTTTLHPVTTTIATTASTTTLRPVTTTIATTTSTTTLRPVTTTTVQPVCNGVRVGSGPSATCRPYKGCQWNGEANLRPHNSALVAYSAPSAVNCNTIKETRTCNDGVWSGSFQNISCSVVTLPTIRNQLQNKTVNYNTSVALSIDAGGNNLSYQWYRNGNAISGANNSVYTFSSGNAESENLYKVRVTNPNGSVDSNQAKVTVHDISAPKITQQPASDTTVRAGQQAVLRVMATGDSLQYRWYRSAAEIPGATSSSFSFYPTSGAYYYVQVYNAKGSVMSQSVRVNVTAGH